METSLREPRAEKVAVVDDVRARLQAASAAFLTEYRGLHVKEMEQLRRALRAAGGEYRIYKNTLVRRAAREVDFAELEALLEGPTGIAFVDGDVAAVAKVLRDFGRANPNLVVKGGLIGRSLLNAPSAAALADLPPRDVLLARFAGLLAAPMQQFASLLQALPQKFAYAMKALIESRGGDVQAPAAEAPAAPEAGASTETAAPEGAVPEAAASEAEASEEAAPEAAAAEEATSEEEPTGESTEEATAEEAPAEEAPAEEAPAEEAPAEEATAEESPTE